MLDRKDRRNVPSRVFHFFVLQGTILLADVQWVRHNKQTLRFEIVIAIVTIAEHYLQCPVFAIRNSHSRFLTLY
jgi:hypothetical protein